MSTQKQPTVRKTGDSVKKPYRAPELAELGTVVELTQNSPGSGGDFNGRAS